MLLLAAALLFLLGLAHSYLGERYLLMRLFRRGNLPALFGGTAFTVGTLRFAWHLTTVAWFGLAFLLVLVAFDALTTARVLYTVAASALLSAAFLIAFTRGRHLSWIVFLAVGVLTLAAIRG